MTGPHSLEEVAVERRPFGQIAPCHLGAVTGDNRVDVPNRVVRLLQRVADINAAPAIHEAMACGLSCIVAELPGITDYIFEGNGSDGVVIPQDDPEALAHHAGLLLSDVPRRRDMGRRARQRVLNTFELEQVADQYVAYYSALTARRQPAHNPRQF